MKFSKPVVSERPSNNLSEPDSNESRLHANVVLPKPEWLGYFTPLPKRNDLEEETLE